MKAKRSHRGWGGVPRMLHFLKKLQFTSELASKKIGEKKGGSVYRRRERKE